MRGTQNEHPGACIYSKQPWFVLGAAGGFALQPANDAGISHFYGFEYGAERQSTLAVPDACVDIVFDCDSTSPKALVCGTTFQATVTPFIPGHHYLGVRFLPGSIPAFIDAAPGELIGRMYELPDIAPRTADLLERIASHRNSAAGVASLEAFIRAGTLSRLSPLTYTLISLIRHRRGNVRIGELAERAGFTRRTLQRKFQVDTGMSPKTFCRIIRFQASIYEIGHRASLDFSGLAVDLGFSDQSHLLREFKRLVGTTPNQYRRRVRESGYLGRIGGF